MQIAAILSDLTSLRVCDHSAALALVSVHKDGLGSNRQGGEKEGQKGDIEEDGDMQRAIDLLDLHYGVKVKHMRGEDAGLGKAKKDVDAVLRRLEGKNMLGEKRP